MQKGRDGQVNLSNVLKEKISMVDDFFTHRTRFQELMNGEVGESEGLAQSPQLAVKHVSYYMAWKGKKTAWLI